MAPWALQRWLMNSDETGDITKGPARGFAGLEPELSGSDTLKADLSLPSSLLDDTLRRQTSEDFLSFIEMVRTSGDQDLAESIRRLERLDLVTSSQLVRAFSMYFHLANVAEQTHRSRVGRRKRETGESPLARVTRLISGALDEGRLDHAALREALAKTDIEIAREYVERLVPARLHSIFERIVAEHDLTVNELLAVTSSEHLLDSQPLPNETLRTRDKYLRPLQLRRSSCLNAYATFVKTAERSTKSFSARCCSRSTASRRDCATRADRLLR